MPARDLVIASANDAFCRTTGCSHAELIGRSMRRWPPDC